MLQQQDAGGKIPPDGSHSKPLAKPKGAATGAAPPGGTAIMQPAAADQPQSAQRCPRCDSLNTKFCYYNNYSLSQPRHFCKNCRRYWTKGGSLRNVPVGGGCRKNKRLKHRDPNSLVASLAEMQDGAPPSSLLSSAMGMGGGGPLPQLPVGFGPSTSCLVSELATELGHQVAGMAFCHSPGNMTTSTQDFFSLATAAPFDPSFPALTYPKPHPQPVMFHQPAHELSPNFFDHNSAQSLPPSTLDHLSSFSSSLTAPVHHMNTTSIATHSATGMDPQLSLIHQMPLPRMDVTHDETGNQFISENQQGIQFEQENAEMSLLRSKRKLSLCSLAGDWQNGPSGPSSTTSNGEANFLEVPSASAAPNEGSIWNVSWPEMHAALAGSSTAGAMLH